MAECDVAMHEAGEAMQVFLKSMPVVICAIYLEKINCYTIQMIARLASTLRRDNDDHQPGATKNQSIRAALQRSQEVNYVNSRHIDVGVLDVTY